MVLLFKSWPVLNTMATYGILWTASDISQELFISKKDHVNWSKTARIATTGTFVIAPIVYTWIHVAEWLLPGKALTTVMKKVIADQVFFAPIGISSFYLATGVLEGRRIDLTELRTKFKKTYLTGMMFWPGIQMVNMRYIPQPYKPIVTGCASFVWTIFLCYMKEPDVQKEEMATPLLQKD